MNGINNAQAQKPFWRKLSFAVAVGLLVLGGSLIPAVNQFIQSIDHHGAYFFNSAAGQSPVFDRIVLLVADDDGRERIILLAAVWFLFFLWRTPSRVAKNRLLGTFFFITLVLVIYILVDSLLDDVIERKSPSMEFLQPFNHIGKILGRSVDVTYRRTFPDLISVILFTAGFMLLRLGRPLGGWISVGLGATLPLLLCVAGLTWLSDIYLGALPIGFIVSAIAVETPIRHVHGTMIDLAAAGMDQGVRFARGLVPLWKHKRLYWQSQNVFHMEVATKRFIAKAVPTILEADTKNARPAPTVEIPLGGLRSLVRIVKLDGQSVIVRAYPVSRRAEALQHFAASTFLQKHHVRVPRILHFMDNPGRFGAIFLVEEFVQGRTKRSTEITDEDIEAVTDQLARLHNVTAEVWGPIDLPRSEDYGNVLFRRVEKQLNRALKGRVVVGQLSHTAAIRRWFEAWKDDLNRITRFSLVHDKLHRENCIFEDDGGFCLIDTTTLLWEVGASDLVVVHHSLCGGDEALIEKLNNLYFRKLEPEVAEQCRFFLPLFEGLFFLSQVQKNIKRMQRSHRTPPADAVDKATYWWRRLTLLVEQHPKD